VVPATSPVGRAPARHRGRHTVERLVESEFVDHRPQDLPDPSILRAAQPLLAPDGRSMSLQILAGSGTLASRLVSVDGEHVRFDGSAAAAGDPFAARIQAMLDESSASPACVPLRSSSTRRTCRLTSTPRNAWTCARSLKPAVVDLRDGAVAVAISTASTRR
jgi:hypothetical protein